MRVLKLGMTISSLSLLFLTAAAPAARGESWKPVFHDADELADAAEDLHDRAQRLGDPRVIPVTAALEELTRRLYHQLKHNACAADVVPLVETTRAVLDEAAALVTLSCEMRGDRKSLSELKNAQRYFGSTHQRIHSLAAHDGFHSLMAPPAPTQPTQPLMPEPGAWRPARGLPRVMLRQF